MGLTAFEKPRLQTSISGVGPTESRHGLDERWNKTDPDGLPVRQLPPRISSRHGNGLIMVSAILKALTPGWLFLRLSPLKGSP